MTQRPSVSRDRWLVSYADFMTLLCAFFTTLYASSLVNASKVEAPAPIAPPVVTVAEELPPTPPAVPDPLIALRAHLTEALHDEVVAGRLQLVDDRRGLVVEVPEAAAFAPGQAGLTPAARETMRRIGAVVAELPNAIRVEGHTDDAPIRTPRFASNWDLSTARATDVVSLFLGEAAIAASRLSAAGYGEHRPRASNATPEGRTRNRRVDIVILNLATEASEEPETVEAPR
jgi:chemotaxis protein MotB